MATLSPFFLLGLALLASFVALSMSDGDEEGEIPFRYVGSKGPEKWASLSQQYTRCGNGKIQSPINIVTKDVVKNSKLKPLVRDYHSTNATLINNRFSIGLKLNHDVGVLEVEGKKYTLTQMHWHTPSEHQIDGEQFPAELHLVHISEEGTLAVVGILFKYGKADPFLSKLEDELEELGKEKCQKGEESVAEIDKVNIKYLRKNNKKFYRYNGSLTTPPCSEGALWSVLTKVKTISKEQVALLQAPLDPEYKSNSRPPQQLNGRKVEVYNKSEDDDDDEN